MNRRITHVARASATAVAAAAGLMALASTWQTPDGFLYAAFDGPLALFEAPAQELPHDVLAIGGGGADAGELAALLQSAAQSQGSNAPVGVTYQAGEAPHTATVTLVPPTSAPQSALTTKQSLNLKPVLDDQGRVDCSGALSCETNPITQVTTVTFADGVVAVVQRINDMTMVAYKTISETFAGPIQAMAPQAPKAASAQSAPPAAGSGAPGAPLAEAPIATGPAAPKPAVPTDTGLTASTVRPNVTVAPLPDDIPLITGPRPGGNQLPGGDTVGKVKDAVGAAIGKVAGAIGNALNPSGSALPAEEPAAE